MTPTHVYQHADEIKPYHTEPLPATLPSSDAIPPRILAMTKYGVATVDVPFNMEQQIQEFEKWETNGIQLDRQGVYSRKVQHPTSEKHSALIKAYVGFVSLCFKRPVHKMDLSIYQEANTFFTYISFLKERESSRGHILHHISLANKINSYIKTKAKEEEHIFHCNR
jgi:hypothetical protein